MVVGGGGSVSERVGVITGWVDVDLGVGMGVNVKMGVSVRMAI